MKPFMWKEVKKMKEDYLKMNPNSKKKKIQKDEIFFVSCQ